MGELEMGKTMQARGGAGRGRGGRGTGPSGEELVARLILRALLGEASVVEIRGRRYRLSVEKVFRLDEVTGSFTYFLRDAGALQRRLRRLARGPLPAGCAVAPGPASGSPVN